MKGIIVSIIIALILVAAGAITAQQLNSKITEKATKQEVLSMLGKCSPESMGQMSANWRDRDQIDSNGDATITGGELCGFTGKTCLFTHAVTYNVGGLVDEVARSPIGCFGGRTSNEGYEQKRNEGMVAWCCNP